MLRVVCVLQHARVHDAAHCPAAVEPLAAFQPALAEEGHRPRSVLQKQGHAGVGDAYI